MSEVNVLNKEKPLFLKMLPGELRTMIYKEVFKAATLQLAFNESTDWIHADLSLLFVCKDIWEEASLALYQSMTLRIFTSALNENGPAEVVRSLQYTMLENVTKLQISIAIADEFGWSSTDFSILHQCPARSFSNLRQPALLTYTYVIQGKGRTFQAFQADLADIPAKKLAPFVARSSAWNWTAHIPFVTYMKDNSNHHVDVTLERRQGSVFCPCDTPTDCDKPLRFSLEYSDTVVYIRHSYHDCLSGKSTGQKWLEDAEVRKTYKEDEAGSGGYWILGGWEPIV